MGGDVTANAAPPPDTLDARRVEAEIMIDLRGTFEDAGVKPELSEKAAKRMFDRIRNLDTAVADARSVKAVIDAAIALDRDNLDNVLVHVCDHRDDAVRRQGLTDEKRRLSNALLKLLNEEDATPQPDTLDARTVEAAFRDGFEDGYQEAVDGNSRHWQVKDAENAAWEKSITRRNLAAAPQHKAAAGVDAPNKLERMLLAAKTAVDVMDTERVDRIFASWGWSPRERDAPAAQGDAEPVASDLLRATIRPRPLDGTLDDYWAAPSSGPLHYEWTDKPHRLLYDLIAAILYAARPSTPTHDDPELDATDGAHPAWWRGSDHATDVVAGIIMKALAGDVKADATFGSRKLTEAVRTMIARLTSDDARRLDAVCANGWRVNQLALEGLWHVYNPAGRGIGSGVTRNAAIDAAIAWQAAGGEP